MPNPNIGEVVCPFCNQKAYIRRYKTGSKSLYIVCDKTDFKPGCGHIRPTLKGGQEWILENATLWPEGVEPSNAETEKEGEVESKDFPAIEDGETIETEKMPVKVEDGEEKKKIAKRRRSFFDLSDL